MRVRARGFVARFVLRPVLQANGPVMNSYPSLSAVALEGSLVHVNPEFAAALGYAPSVLLGRALLDIMHAEDRAPMIERVEGLLASGEPVLAREQRILRADGRTLDLEISAVRIELDGRKAALAILRDLNRREVTAHMMQMDRMLSVGLVAAGLGHEINNPLSVVAANVDLALRTASGLVATSAALSAQASPDMQAALSEFGSELREIRESLADARQGARRVQSIVRDLRAFSRPEVDATVPIEIEGVLQAAVAMVRNEIHHRAQLVKSFERVPAVVGNEARLGQVFLNLLINAVHAIPVGEANKHEIRLRTRASPAGVVIEISDTGCGISPRDLPRIFEPFYTTKPIGQGTGLGLAICRNIVLSLGGTIDVDSVPGSGTTFRVTLPAAKQSAPPRTESGALPLAVPSRRLKVLVVDDEPLIGRVVRRCLGPNRDVRWVGSGQAALELLLPAQEHFDVVFLDVMMPEMTGIEVYELVAKQRPDMLSRVVFLTGGAFTAEATEFLARIPNRQMSKPFDPRQLREMAEEIAALVDEDA
jgi:two-component system, cell cycle sensor histidine kinase and response regulator CckA